MESFSDFIRNHENDDAGKLLLSWKGRTEFDIRTAVCTIEVRRKIRKKLPSWYSRYGIVYPVRLAGEQCSSEDTAMYKARLAASLFPEKRPVVADLTGGLGVDSWAFSKIASNVFYNERDKSLTEAAGNNFRLLGAENISVCSSEISPDTIDGILAGSSPDLVFLDPARRDSSGKKVFLLEDCSPDVLGLKDMILGRCRYLLLKLSPMADIGMLSARLGQGCREIHVLSSGGECKEVLVLMDSSYSGAVRIVAATGRDSMEFSMDEIRKSAYIPAGSSGLLKEGGFLFEPCSAILKAGAFNVLCSRFPIEKLSEFTHYYVMNEKETAQETLRKMSSFGKFFKIIEILPLNNRNLKDAGKKYPGSEATARNIRMDTATMLEKMKMKAAGNRFSDHSLPYHVFGLRCDLPDLSGNFLLITEKSELA